MLPKNQFPCAPDEPLYQIAVAVAIRDFSWRI